MNGPRTRICAWIGAVMALPWPAESAEGDQTLLWAHHALETILEEMPQAERHRAGLRILQEVSREDRPAAITLLHSAGIDITGCFKQWAAANFDRALEVAEEIDGFGGNEVCRPGVIRALAEENPVAAARMMRARLDPLNLHYYYYVVIHGLVPAMKKQPARVVLQTLPEMTAYDEGLDSFRSGDAIHFLIHDEMPWTPPSLRKDWQEIATAPLSFERDLVRAGIAVAGLRQDLAAWISIDVSDIDEDAFGSALRGWNWPADPARALALLGKAHRRWMSAWVDELISVKQPPDWPHWAEVVQKISSAAERDHATDLLLHLWSSRDDQAARAWAISLPTGGGKEAAEAAIAEYEIHQGLRDRWPGAFARACELPHGPARARCLLAAFQAAAHLDAAAAREAMRQAGAADAPEWQNAWALARIRSPISDAERLVLTCGMHGDWIRRRQMELLVINQEPGKWRKLIQESPISQPIRQELLEIVAKEGAKFRAHSLKGDPLKPALAAMTASHDIRSPEARLMHQRHIVHETAMRGLESARQLLQESELDPETHTRLWAELEKVRNWQRPPAPSSP